MLAAWKAARGKRLRPDVRPFFASFDESLARLASDIRAGRVPYGDYRTFRIHDPKERVIYAACFDDRVLHHAILNLTEDVFERTLLPTTYACRPRLGVHRAQREVQRGLQRFPWFGKIDIDAYFPSIDHAILQRLLARRCKGADFLALLARIIASCPAAAGKGLPIGSLTSQHFANHYLDGADRFLVDHPAVRAHVRYMDDIIWWGDDCASVKRVLGELRAWLHSERRLHVKPAVQINRSQRGVTYCGARILPGVMRLPRRKQRRYRERWQFWERAWEAGAIDERQLQSAYAAVLAATLPIETRTWRRRQHAVHGSRYSSP